MKEAYFKLRSFVLLSLPPLHNLVKHTCALSARTHTPSIHLNVALKSISTLSRSHQSMRRFEADEEPLPTHALLPFTHLFGAAPPPPPPPLPHHVL